MSTTLRKNRGRFLLFPNGSAGDLHPYIVIGRRLQRRGHDVTVLTNPLHRSLIERQDLNFVEIGHAENLKKLGAGERIHHWRESNVAALEWAALGTMRSVYAEIERRNQPGETVVVAPGFALGARLAREKLNVPLATIHLEPGLMRTLYDSAKMPAPMMMGPTIPKWFKAWQLLLLDKCYLDRKLGPEINRFRAELGLPKQTRFLNQWWHSPDLVLGLFPEWYAEPQPDWPSNLRLTDFPRWDPPIRNDDQEELERFLKNNPKPIVALAGTAGPRYDNFFRVFADACEALKRPGIFLTQLKRLVPDRLPANVKHFPFLPLADVLPHASTFIHHGGIGTVAQSLAAGVPQLVVPAAFNQPDEARRLKRLGVAEILLPEQFRTKRLVSLLKKLNDEPFRTRCKEIAARFENENPMLQTCNELQSLIGARPDVGSEGNTG